MTNLCCLSAFSFGKSSVSIKDYVSRSKKLGYDCIGICDLNHLYSLPSFFDACNKEGIKGIAGVTLKVSDNDNIFNCSLFVLNEQGYSNLCMILSKKKEVYLKDDFSSLDDGLAFVTWTNKDTSIDGLDSFSQELSSIFKYYYIGIGISNKEDEQKMNEIRTYASNHSYECVCFPKVFYLEKKSLFTLDVLKSNLENRPLTSEELSDEDNGGPDFLLSPKIRSNFYLQEEIDNADKIANLIDFNLFNKKRGGLFSFTGTDDGDFELFKQKTIDGLKRRNLLGNKKYEDRLEYETSIISKMGFLSYFLIVQDYVNYAKSVGIKVGPGRGSAAGSLVSYLLGITDIDPIEYNLSFERFLNPKRVTMPDIDMDFEDDRRDEIVDYLTKKYGPSRTAKIITFGSYKARSAIKASGLSLNIQPQRLKQLSDSLPNYGIESTSLSDAYKFSIRFQKLCSDSYYKRIFDIAKSIESLPTNPSIHAAGVIISNIDIYRQAQMSEGTFGIVEYEYPNMERMGFLKVDLLSLHYLTIIKNIEEIMKEEGHKIPDYQSLKDDPETYKTINSLDLSLIFQLDGNSGMKQAIKEIKPSNYNDLVALIALYRPGPKDNIPTYAKNKHSGVIPSSGYKEVDEILKDTYGVLVYQEQILKLAHDIAGMDMGEADLLRRAISKKHLDDMEKYKSRFIQGAQKHGLSLSDANGIYDLILKFANYGFNKSHSVSYALLTFQLAYLKTHEPEAFYKVAFDEISPGDEKFRNLALELKHRNIKLMPVNPNKSDRKERFVGDCCYLGLSRIKNLTDSMIDKIVEERKKRQFDSLGDILLRCIAPFHIDKRTMSSLIDSGLFDVFGFNRKTLGENLVPLFDFMDAAIDPSQLPILKEEHMSDMDLAKAFIKEQTLVGVSISISLSKLVSNKIPRGYTVAMANEDGQPTNNGVVVTLANPFTQRKFIFGLGLKIETYDLVVFKPVVSKGFKRLWEGEDVKVISLDKKENK